MKSMETILSEQTSITKLDLSSNHVGGVGLGNLMRICPNLHTLNISDCGLKEEDMKSMEAILSEQTSITKLDLSSNHVGGVGLGNLMRRCPNLHTLDIPDCGLKEEDMKSMEAILSEQTSITKLDLSSNHVGGDTLGRLVRRWPNVHTLDLSKCGLHIEDIESMVASMPEQTSITQLSLSSNSFFFLEGGAAVGRLLQRTPWIQLLDVCGCGLYIPALLQAAGRAVLTNLLVLDLGFNYDPQLEVSGYLASMPRLQALSVAGCDCYYVQDLLRLVAPLPPTLTHLNVCDNHFGRSVVEVLQHKERLARLHRLNIGWDDQDDECGKPSLLNIKDYRKPLPLTLSHTVLRDNQNFLFQRIKSTFVTYIYMISQC